MGIRFQFAAMSFSFVLFLKCLMRLPLLHLCLIPQDHLLLSKVVLVLPAGVDIVMCLSLLVFSCAHLSIVNHLLSPLIDFIV